MKEIVERLTEKRRIETAKKILESEGYEVSRINESTSDTEEGTTEDSLMRDNATFKKIDSICKKYGYELYDAYVKVYEKSGNKYPRVSIRKVQKFHPEIYYNNSLLDKKVNYFSIQTTSYGSLEKEEYEEFLKGCQDAYNLVSELEKIDLETLAIIEEE